MSRTVEKLQQELEAARRIQADMEDLLKEAEDIVGKAFLRVFSSGKGTRVATVTLYKKAEADEEPAVRRGEASLRMICSCVSALSGPRSEVLVDDRQELHFTHYDILQVREQRQIDRGVFRQLAKSGRYRAASMLEQMLQESDLVLPYEEPAKPIEEEPDVPFLQLEHPFQYLFSDSPFLLPGGRYLITERSAFWIRKKAMKLQEDLDRILPYTEDCDRQYVTGQRQICAKLQELEKACRERLLQDKSATDS